MGEASVAGPHGLVQNLTMNIRSSARIRSVRLRPNLNRKRSSSEDLFLSSLLPIFVLQWHLTQRGNRRLSRCFCIFPASDSSGVTSCTGAAGRRSQNPSAGELGLLRRSSARNDAVSRAGSQDLWRQHVALRPSLRATEGSAAISIHFKGLADLIFGHASRSVSLVARDDGRDSRPTFQRVHFNSTRLDNTLCIAVVSGNSGN
jgi:hypothetical protein